MLRLALLARTAAPRFAIQHRLHRHADLVSLTQMAYAFHATPVNALSIPTPSPPPSFDPRLLEGHLRALKDIVVHNLTAQSWVEKRELAVAVTVVASTLAATVAWVLLTDAPPLLGFAFVCTVAIGTPTLVRRYFPDWVTTPAVRAWREKHGCIPRDWVVEFDAFSVSRCLASLPQRLHGDGRYADPTKREGLAYEETTSLLIGLEQRHPEEEKKKV